MQAKRLERESLVDERRGELAGSRTPGGESKPPVLEVADEWTAVLSPASRPQLEALLVGWLQGQRWFGGKARQVTNAAIQESIPIPCGDDTALYNLVQVDYLQGDADWYAVPLAFAEGKEAESVRRLTPSSIVCELRVSTTGRKGVLHGALRKGEFCKSLLELIAGQRHIKSGDGGLEASCTPLFRRILGDAALPEPIPAKAEQSNSSVVYGDRFILKLFRRLEVGINPDYELTRFLTARGFDHAQQLAGALEFRRPTGQRITLGMLNRFLPRAKDAWAFTLEELGHYYGRAAALIADGQSAPLGEASLAKWIEHELHPAWRELVGAYRDSARLLGQRTAEMHLALASEAETQAFAPEPFSPDYFRGVFESMHSQARQNFELLRKGLKALPADILPLARRVLELEPAIISRFRWLYERPITARRIRCHGDYHLGQVLYSGGDFVIIDFEGEPALPLRERRIKRSPLRDVAGMVRSFDYAAWAGLHDYIQRRGLGRQSLPDFEPWLRVWHQAVSSVFLRAYRETMGESEIVPHSREELSAMLPAYLLNKAVYEVGYELNNRPFWLRIPLLGILEMFGAETNA